MSYTMNYPIYLIFSKNPSTSMSSTSTVLLQEVANKGPELKSEKIYPFICSSCWKLFAQKSYFKKHQSSCSGNLTSTTLNLLKTKFSFLPESEKSTSNNKSSNVIKEASSHSGSENSSNLKNNFQMLMECKEKNAINDGSTTFKITSGINTNEKDKSHDLFEDYEHIAVDINQTNQVSKTNEISANSTSSNQAKSGNSSLFMTPIVTQSEDTNCNAPSINSCNNDTIRQFQQPFNNPYYGQMNIYPNRYIPTPSANSTYNTLHYEAPSHLAADSNYLAEKGRFNNTYSYNNSYAANYASSNQINSLNFASSGPSRFVNNSDLFMPQPMTYQRIPTFEYRPTNQISNEEVSNHFPSGLFYPQ